MSSMTMNLTPRLKARLESLEQLTGEKNPVDVISEALRFYEEILKRALEGKKIRIPLSAVSPADENRDLSRFERRRDLAAKVGLVPRP
jgi:hypothetical protein